MRRTKALARSPGKLDRFSRPLFDLSLTSIHGVQGLPSFMLNPPSKELWENKWDQVHEMFKYERFWRLTLTWPEHDRANADIIRWGDHTWTVLEQFAFHGPYSCLSQKVLKFYGELQKTAAACAFTAVKRGRTGSPLCRVSHGKWGDSYHLIVSAGVPRNTRAHWIDLVPFIPRSCPGRLKPF